MKSFHRTKKDSRVLGFFVLCFVLVLSMIFMLVGFHLIIEEGKVSMEIIFGIAGVAVFLIFLRGAWMMASGSLTHVFSIDRNELIWGFVGKEKTLKIVEVRHIYWDDTDGFTLVMTTRDGRKVRFPYIETVVTNKSRPKLLIFFRTVLPMIPFDGCIEKKTEQVAVANP